MRYYYTTEMSAGISRKQGFSLVELSIVLVIIGLLSGAILVGKSLIKSAELSKHISHVNQLSSAINTFTLKYSCLPGDCTNETGIFGANLSSKPACASGNGDGDGRIDHWTDNGNSACESVWAIDVLILANLIPQSLRDGTGEPYLIGPGNGSGYLYYTDLYGVNTGILSSGIIKTGVTLSWANQTMGPVAVAAISPSDAFQIDSKMDDGLPQTGDFYGINSILTGTETTLPQDCLITGQNAYQNSDVIGCRTVYFLSTN